MAPTRRNSLHRQVRHLVVILGDQLDPDSAALEGFDPHSDRVWMAEVREEATHVWSHKARIALFLSAMRHFRDTLWGRGYAVEYWQTEDRNSPATLAEGLGRAIRDLRPGKVVLVEPGDFRVLESLRSAVADTGVPLEILVDRHFFTTLDEFADFARGRRQLRLEHFYRRERKRHRVLMDGDQPAGGQWNYDADNRAAFGSTGPENLPPPPQFPPDALTRKVLRVVEEAYPDHPGVLEHFAWPVTTDQARQALDDFVKYRLPRFGAHQDAMWTDQPFLYHSLLSAALNLKLLNPREVVAAAERAYRRGEAPLAAVEGFVRQVLGWREFVRGIYWTYMPSYAASNALDARLPLPDFYWTGDTNMVCLRQVLRQTLDLGYAHHIQRLMVTGLFALLLGVEPRAVHEWYLAVYVDAVEWVELPNTVGMSQFADGGRMASKPYAASGKYIRRMSNYCDNCPYDPERATDESACPFTTLYWDFLLRNRDKLASNQRIRLQLRNAERLSDAEQTAIRARSATLRHDRAWNRTDHDA